MTPLDPISLGIMWDRLVSITDEVLTALVRTSFSTNVRESYDLSCLLFSGDGTSMAQGTYSVPSFTGTGPATLAHMLRKFPAETLSPGDVVVTNDPWMGTGHLFDINVMRPVFRGARLVGYSLSITHLPDIGGRGFSATAAEIYEEGLRLPVCKLVRAGQVDADLLDLICTNVRVPEHVVGDLMANVTCNEVAGRLLLELMDEYRLDELDTLAAGITSVADAAMRERIRAIPDGVYANRFQLEGADRPIALACRVTVSGDTIHIDCDGTDPVVPLGINVPLCYTRAFAAYAVKCLTTPRIPNNEGSLRAITTTAPVGCILNAVPPSATGGRHVVGHFVTPLVFGALAQGFIDASLGSPSAAPRTGLDASLGSPSAAPRTAIGDIPADSGMLNLMNFQGRHPDGRGVSSIYFASGGYGALDGMDGAACTPFPSNMTSTPVETWENLTSVTIERKAFLIDSGGPGRYRGGLGQEIVFRNDSGHPMTVACFGARTEFPSLGIRGGQPGSLRRYLLNDAPAHSKGRYVLAPGDVIRTWEPGGGGFGDPRERSRDAVRADVRSGFVSPEAARREYGMDANAPADPMAASDGGV